MNKNMLLKILFSLPIILVVFYFMPFFGIVMLMMRKFIIPKSKYPLGITFIVITTIIVMPKLIDLIFELFKLDKISYISDIINSDIYPVLVERSKILFILGVILLIIDATTKKLKNSAINGLRSYFSEMQKNDPDTSENNDLLTDEKMEKVKNTKFVRCPHCGASNVMHGKNVKCAFCKSNLE